MRLRLIGAFLFYHYFRGTSDILNSCIELNQQLAFSHCSTRIDHVKLPLCGGPCLTELKTDIMVVRLVRSENQKSNIHRPSTRRWPGLSALSSIRHPTESRISLICQALGDSCKISASSICRPNIKRATGRSLVVWCFIRGIPELHYEHFSIFDQVKLI